jgi:hypothetical protein
MKATKWIGVVLFVVACSDPAAFDDGDSIASVGEEIGSPTNLRAVGSNSQVQLTWDAVPGATYNISRKVSPATMYSVLVTGVVTTSYLDAPVMNGVNHSYRVVAIIGEDSAVSNTASATPTATPPPPPNVLVAVPGNELVNLSWTPVTDASSYKVKRGSFPCTSPTSTVTVPSGNSYMWTLLTNDTRVCFWVSATKGNLTTVNTGPVTVTPTGTTVNKVLKNYWSELNQDNLASIVIPQPDYTFFNNVGKAASQPSGSMKALWHWYSPSRKDSYLSTDTAWNPTVAGSGWADYGFVRLEGFIYSTPEPGTVGLYNHWSDTRQDNYVSTSSAPPAGYVLFNQVGYVLP